jgi:hypothetical protein
MLTNFTALAAQTCHSDSAQVLSRIFQPAVNLAVWQRTLPAELLDCAAQLCQQLPGFALQRQVALADLPQLLQNAVPDLPGSAVLRDDIYLQADMLACLMDTDSIGLRLKVLSQPMCPRFHTDHIALRLLVTYAGPATEWRAGPELTDAVNQLQIGDCALLKGSAWPQKACPAVWHRSPTGTMPRLLLTLDPL